MTFTVINYDNTTCEYTAESWEEFVRIADLDKCVSVLVKEGVQKIK